MADPGNTELSTPGGDGQATADAKAKIRDTADRARHEASRMVEDAKTRGESVLNEQRQSAAGQLDGVANALREAARKLDQQNQSGLAEYADWTAGCLSGCARQLRESDMGEMVDQVQSFARRRPGLFLGGAVAAGLLAARFLRSSEERRSMSTGTTPYGPHDSSRSSFPRDPVTRDSKIGDSTIGQADSRADTLGTPGGPDVYK